MPKLKIFLTAKEQGGSYGEDPGWRGGRDGCAGAEEDTVWAGAARLN